MILVCDFDKTLVKNDFFAERFFQTLISQPWVIARQLLQKNGMLTLKNKLLFNYKPAYEIDFLINKEVVEWIGLNKYRFDTTFLISASPMDFVQKIVSPLNIFDEIIGSKTVNLKGHTKLNYITTNLNANFCYIGDSIADIPLFKSSSEAYLVKKGKLKKIK